MGCYEVLQARHRRIQIQLCAPKHTGDDEPDQRAESDAQRPAQHEQDAEQQEDQEAGYRRVVSITNPVKRPRPS
jgi:hypothetical protein